MNPVAAMYRKLLKIAKPLNPTDRMKFEKDLRLQFKNANATNEEAVKLMKQTISKISYVKMVSRKHASNDSGVVHYMYKNGKRVDYKHNVDEGAKYKQFDLNENIKRHKHLVERQHFMHRK